MFTKRHFLAREISEKFGIPLTTAKRHLRQGFCPLSPRVSGLTYREFDALHGLRVGMTSHNMRQGFCKWPRKRAADWHHPLASTYTSMLQRCHNPKNSAYHNYGARGIEVCPRWRVSFDAFLADMGDKPGPEYTLDRVDNNGPYSPDNCRWATWTEQHANKRDRPALKELHQLKSNNALGEPFIHWDKYRRRFRVKFKFRGGDFRTLAEAIQWRDGNYDEFQLGRLDRRTGE